MADETRTSRDTIRAAIEEWALLWREGEGRGSVALSQAPMADLVERIVRALFGDAPDHPCPWRTGGHPADEPGPRQRTIYDATGEMIGAMFTTAAARLAVDAVNVGGDFASLAELAEEIRRALYLTPLQEVMGRGVMADEVSRIAKILREPAARPDGAHVPDEE